MKLLGLGSISSVVPALFVTALGLSVAGCGSIKAHHRTGSLADNSVKIPGATGGRLVLQSTVLATLKSPWISSKIGGRMLLDRVSTVLAGGVVRTSMKMPDDPRLLPKAGGEEFEALLDREGLPARSKGSVKFFVDGAAFYPDLFRAVDGARQGIDVQSYIFDNDHFGVEVADRLKRKSRVVPVRVYMDSMGSLLAAKAEPAIPHPPGFIPPGNLKSYLTHDSLIEVRKTANPYFVADHTKLHVIDDKIAFVGGMNLGVEYRFTWHDLMARIEGPIVHHLGGVYRDHWHGEEWQRHWGLRGWFEKDPPPPPVTPAVGRQVPLRLLLTDTPLGKREVLKAALAGIRCARERVWIETPYFTSDEISAELKKAVQRGVDVRVIVPGSNDSKLMEKANVAELKKLMETGAKVYEYPGMTHLKATICDNWGMIGSANYDTLSMRINRELNLAISDPETVRQLARKVFEKDFQVSSRLSLEKARARGGVFAEVIGDQL
jgi:cardiolipin synthase